MGSSLQDHWATGEIGMFSPARKEQLIELCVFLGLIAPSLILNPFLFRQGVFQQGELTFTLVATGTILRDLGLVFLIWFFLWRNGEPMAYIGWTRSHIVRETLLGVVLFVPVFIGAVLLQLGLLRAGFSGHAPWPVLEPEDRLLALFLVPVVAFAEETIFRGYFILRLHAVVGSTTGAVVLSSAVFAIAHADQGSAAVVTIGIVGAIKALIYVWRGSLVAPIVIHFLLDFLAILLLPGLK
jgi:membrane protease YdiL (CAAX protease family)